MKRLSLSVLSVSIFALMPVIAGAAGTYYNGNNYRSSQRYGSASGGYYNNYGAGRGYEQSQRATSRSTTTRTTKKSGAQQKPTSAKKGFQLDAALSHEFADWDIEMEKAGSKLRYDGLAWNVLSVNGAYYFDTSTPMQINIGARYGMQSGQTSMIDDDISKGGYGSQTYTEGIVTGYAMSVGTSKDGTQMGFNAGFGLTDFFSVGRVKMTPSIGYRYFKHKLVTKDNSGLTMDVFNGNSSHPYVNCIELNGETQCDPFVLFEFITSSGTETAVTGRQEDELGSLTDIFFNGIPAGTTAVAVDLGDTYYYRQAGTSHEYETEWYGPYLALDMEYAISNTNNVTAGIELGLPMYDSKGNQPYRVDWAHPTSVEDKGGLGKAYHLGLNAAWSTAITDSVMFSLGLTYDYYNAKKADATTYINQSYYTNIVTNLENAITYLTNNGGSAETIAAYQASLDEAEENVAYYSGLGWKIESKEEIKSVYSSMGIRMGVSVKF